MYYEEKWVDGWLYIRSLPNAEWEQASDAMLIARLRERVAEQAGVN